MDSTTRHERIRMERRLEGRFPTFPTLPLSHRLVVVQDTFSIARARPGQDPVAILSNLIGGDRNLRRYADTLVAMADRRRVIV